METIIKLIDEQKWIFAKTMPQNPHEYCLRKNFENQEQFEEFVTYIRCFGVKETFKGRSYTVLYVGNYKYWTMGAALDKTILINRAKCEQKRSYDDVAEEYETMFASPEYKAEDKALFDLIAPMVKGRVLDVGCGTGLLLDNIAIEPLNYVGIDPSKGMVEILRKKHPNHPVIAKRFGDAPIEEGSFDTVVALYGSLSYLTQEEQHKIQAALSCGGLYFLMAYNDGYYPITHKKFDIPYLPEATRCLFKDTEVVEYGNYLILTNYANIQK